MTGMIYHMGPAETWDAAVRAGSYDGTADDRRDGFIHFSAADQIADSARRHRAGQQGLVLVAVEAERLGERPRWGPARGGALFPPPYGPPLPTRAGGGRPFPPGPPGPAFFPPLLR